MEELIRALLLADAAVASFVGNRVNYGTHPQGDPFPGLVLNTIGDVEGMNIDGPDGTSQGRVQVDCYADSYGGSKLLSRAVRRVLSGHAGGAILGVFHASSRDSREGGTNEAEHPFRVSLDFTVTYTT
ncbi:tail completion protein gp17 [Sulfitobacter sp. SH24]|uniref:tail completion protein gp17 n=1 Tax=Sulfitobacter sp. SH24 TaxID=3421173 RepID=UPI003F506909